MMDPIAHILTTLKYLEQAAEKMRSNRGQCSKLVAHTRDVLLIIKHERETNRLPGDLTGRLRTLNKSLSDLYSLLSDLSNQPMLKRFLWRDRISSKISSANKSLEGAVEIFHLGTQIDIRRFQEENEAARRADTDELQKALERLMHNEDQILDHLGVHRAQMQEAMVSVYKHMHKLSNTIERRFLEVGLDAMQRRSGPLSMQPDRYVITTLDITVYEHKKLGQGGYSTVYLGDYLGTTVAVKRMVPGVPDHIMQQEINVWKELRHPHILLFMGACSIADPPFIISKFMSNGDAASFLRKTPDADRVQIMLEASLGLVYLHSNGVIHCDLKASNILIDENKCACLADFGLSEIKLHTTVLAQSHVSANSPRSLELAGSVQWMAPERLSGKRPTKWADIWSFGMTMWEVFSGRPPFGEIHIAYLLNAVKEGLRPPDPREEDPKLSEYDLDDQLWALIKQCWEELPDSRPSTSALRAALEHHIMKRGRRRAGAGRSDETETLIPGIEALDFTEDMIRPSTTSSTRTHRSRSQSPSHERPYMAMPEDRKKKQSTAFFRKAFRGSQKSQPADRPSPIQPLLDAITPSPFNIPELQPNPFPNWLFGLPLDLSLRLLLLHLKYPNDDSQSLNTAVSHFALAWVSRYPTLMGENQVRRVTYDLIMTNLEHFDKQRASTTLDKFVQGMQGEGVDDVLAEYLYHNITYAPFLYLEDLQEIQKRKALRHTPVAVSRGKVTTGGFKSAKTMDMYIAVIQNNLEHLRVKTHGHLGQSDGNWAYFRTHTSSWTLNDARATCLSAPRILVFKAPRAGHSGAEWRTALTAAGIPYQPKTDFNGNSEISGRISIRLISVGVLQRKFQDKTGLTLSNWEPWGLALTPSSLYFFRSTGWLSAFKARADAEAESWTSSSHATNHLQRAEDFNPDEELSLHGVIAAYDETDSEATPTFHVVTPGGMRYSFRSASHRTVSELDSWLGNINYAAAHETLQLPMSFSLPPRASPQIQPSTPRVEAEQASTASTHFPDSSAASTLERIRNGVAGPREDTLRQMPRGRSQGSVLGLAVSLRPGSRPSSEIVTTPVSEGATSSSASRMEHRHQCISRLVQTVLDIQTHLEPALRTSRTYAMLVPFEQSTRVRIQTAELHLSKTIEKMRLDLAKWEGYLEIARFDLAAESDEWERRFDDEGGREGDMHGDENLLHLLVLCL